MPAFDAHKNFAYSTVATAPSPATSGTSLVVAAGDGAKFPAVPFNATVWPASSQPTVANAEIVRVTGRSTDTLTIVRAQENTSARTVIVGDQIAETITAKTLTDVETAATATPGSFSFVLYDNYQRFTIADANVTTASKIIGTIRRPNIEEVDDTGWFYDFNVIKVANGSFDINVWASQWGENADQDLASFLTTVDEFESGTGSGIAVGSTTAQQTAQSFIPLQSAPFYAVTLSVGLSGAPTDRLLVTIQADSAGVPSGTVLASTSIPPSSLSASAFRTLTVYTNDSPSLTAGNTYWVVLSRDGALDDTNGYETESSLLGYGLCKSFDGSSWNFQGRMRFAFQQRAFSSEQLTLNYLLPA